MKFYTIKPVKQSQIARIKELDGIRGIAILLVLIWHYIRCQVRYDKESIWAYLSATLNLTWSGVDLFFVLSGFLIVGILLDAKGAESYFKTFYARRICRIVPLYLLMLCLFLIIPLITSAPNEWLFAKPLPLFSYFTFTQNFFMHNNGFGPHWLGVTWSLAIEEQFYLFIPVLIFLLSRRQLYCVFFTLIVMAPTFRLVIGDLGAYVFPFTRSDAILMGGLLALLLRNPSVRKKIVDNYNYLLGAFFIFLFGSSLFILMRAGIGGVFVHFWLSVLYSLFIVVCLFGNRKVIDKLVSNRIFVWLGLRSYGIYLFHQPISGMIHNFMNGNEEPSFSNLSEFYPTLIALLAVLLLAEISYRYFESIFLLIGKKFTYEFIDKDENRIPTIEKKAVTQFSCFNNNA